MSDHSSDAKPVRQTIKLSCLVMNAGTQLGEMNEAVYAEYFARAKNGERPPPIRTINDGKRHWPWDGFHRIRLHHEMNWKEIDVLTKTGTKEDARRLAAKANKDNGRPRTDAEKRAAIARVVSCEPGWSFNRIASYCGVSIHTVKAVHKVQVDAGKIAETTTAEGADGKRRPRTTLRRAKSADGAAKVHAALKELAALLKKEKVTAPDSALLKTIGVVLAQLNKVAQEKAVTHG